MKKITLFTLALVLTLSLALSGCGKKEAAKNVNLTLYFPVSVGGPIAAKLKSYVDEFNKQNEGKIHVDGVFSGSYTDTSTKVKAAVKANNAPDLAILLQTDIFDLTDLGYVQPLDDYIKKAGSSYINDFYPALLAGSKMKGKIYSLPFQRSTQILFYNKDLFAQAGIQNPPNTWDELIADGKKLTKIENGKAVHWGLQVPMGGFFSYWNIQPFILQNGVSLANAEGTKVKFNDPKTVEAVQFFYDLAHKYNIMPAGTQGWGDIPTNFLAQKAAMVIHSTGSLSNIRKKAEFKFGVAPLPTNGGKRTNLGGGNIYMFKSIPQSHKDAAWKFIQFLTSPEKVADWSMASGYIATRKSAYETPAMKDFITKYPEYTVARDELKDAGAEFATHNDGKVVKDFSDQVEAVITGSKTAKAAMDEAQKNAERDLKGF